MTVNNVAPTVTLTGARVGQRGHDAHLQLHDAAIRATTRSCSSRPTCGAGGTQVGTDTFNTTTGAGSFDCSFPDGPASPTVSVHGRATPTARPTATPIDVTVNNVAPTVTLTG